MKETATAQIEALGMAAAECTQNSDILMRFSHYTDYHGIHFDTEFPCCPECSKGKPKTYLGPEADFSDEVDSRPNQTLQNDAEEVLHGIHSLRFGQIIQRKALEHTLERLKSVKMHDLDGLPPHTPPSCKCDGDCSCPECPCGVGGKCTCPGCKCSSGGKCSCHKIEK
jgi:hypothetical protein